METKTLYYFLKIAECENITKAADILHIAQPHLTRQLKTLEDELGVQLFLREKKRLHITEEGRFVKKQAEQIFELMDKTKKQVVEIHSGISGRIYIGATETVGTVYLPEWIAGFNEEYPNVKYNLWTANSEDVIERLDQKLIDVALVREPFDPEKYNSLHVMDEEWIALMGSNHPLVLQSDKPVSFKQLSKEDLIVPTQRSKQISEWFVKVGLEANIVCEFAPLMNAIVLAERYLGVAILPESAIYAIGNHSVTARKMAVQITSGVSLIWRKDTELSGVAKRFTDFISAWVQKATAAASDPTVSVQ